MSGDALARAEAAMAAAAAKQGNEVVALEVGDIIAITDYFVVADAPTTRQMRTILDEIERRLRDEFDIRPRAREGQDGPWVILDYGDLVVHVFLAEAREHFGLDRLWADAPRRAFPAAEPPGTAASA